MWGALGGSPMEGGVVGQPCETPYFQPWHRHPLSWNDLPKNSVGPPQQTLHYTGVRHSRSWSHKWSVAASAACECDAEDQTVNHAVLQCPIHRPPHGLHGLTVLDYETIRLAVDHLPRDLVRPSSGLQELAQTMMMKQLVLACCRHSHLNKPCCAVFCVMNGLMMKTWFFIHSFSSPIPPWNKFPPRNQRFLPWWVRWLLFEKHWSRASTSKLSMLAI